MERRIIDLGSNRAGARGTTDRLVSPPVCFRPFDRARVSLRALEMVQPICKAIFFFFFSVPDLSVFEQHHRRRRREFTNVSLLRPFIDDRWAAFIASLTRFCLSRGDKYRVIRARVRESRNYLSIVGRAISIA